MNKTVLAALAGLMAFGAESASLKESLGSNRLASGSNRSSYVCIFNELEELDDAADRAWRALDGRAAYDSYRRTMRERMIAAMGGFPARTPLNAKTVGSYARDGYRIEKVIFESRPGLHVTANLFVPTAPEFKAPYPAVVMSCGHSGEGKDCTTYLRACVLAAKNGLVAFMFDPYAQGERRDGSELGCCHYHTQLGLRAALLGGSAAQLRVWDGIRAIDYVETRPEVDREKIGYMGQSGGGTLTALMTAVDLRLKATAPSCYLTTLTSLCEHMGPQDAEQNIFGQLAFGLNHTGYVLIPDTKVAVTCKFSDMFTYYGTRKLFRTVEAVAAKVGSAGNYMLNDAPGPHEWTEATEASSVEWMRAWLRGEKERLPIDMTAFRARDLGFSIDTDADLGLAPEERGCLPTKRTRDIPGERGIFAILRDEFHAAEKARPPLPTGAARAALVKRMAKIRTAAEAKPLVKELVRETIDGCDVLHLAVLYANGLALPAELVTKAGAVPKAAVVSVGRKGRAAALEAVRTELDAGKAVLVADLTGLGSIGEGRFLFYRNTAFPEEGTSAMLYLMGESMVGRRATDLLVLADVLAARGFGDVSLVAADDVAIAAAHAFAAAPGAFSSVRTVDPAPAWANAFAEANDGKTAISYTELVNGALHAYDWVDLLKP